MCFPITIHTMHNLSLWSICRRNGEIQNQSSNLDQTPISNNVNKNIRITSILPPLPLLIKSKYNRIIHQRQLMKTWITFKTRVYQWISIEIPRMFSLVRSRNKIGRGTEEARMLELQQQASSRKTIRKRKRAGIFSWNRDRDAGISQFEAVLVAIVPWTLTSFFQFIIHYFDVIRPVDPGASSLNSWYHSVDFSSQPIIRFGQSVSIVLEGPAKENYSYNLIWRYIEIFETIGRKSSLIFQFRDYVTYIIIIMISY